MNLKGKIKAFLRDNHSEFYAKIKDVLRPIEPVLSWIRFGPVGYETVPTAISYFKRRMFPNLPSRYSRIKTLKDIHKGQKMFIVATGPSLTAEDLNALKGHLSMGVNSIPLSYDHTDWRPDYYVAIDMAVVNYLRLDCNKGKSFDLWHNIDPSHIIVSHYFKGAHPLPDEVILMRTMRSRLRKDGTGEIKFSGDCYLRVCDSYTVTYSALQLAVYMGCSEIYLLGVDCNYTGNPDKDHAFKFDTPDETNRKNIQEGTGGMIAAYTAAKKYADEHGIKIFNATRGGKLEVFPRISLEEALKD